MMRLLFKYYLQLFLFGFFLSPFAISQQVNSDQNAVPGYEIRHYTDENGLPQNSVKSVVRDSRGNIWLATERGLVRFDGNRFVKFDDFGNSYSDRNISGFYMNPETGRKDVLAMTSNRIWVRIKDGKAAIDTSLKGYPLHRSVDIPEVRDPSLIEALPDLNEASMTHYHYNIVAIYPTPNARHFAYDEQNVGYYIGNKLTKTFRFPRKSFVRFFCVDDNLYHLDDKLNLTCFPGPAADSNPVETVLNGALSAHNPGGRHQLFWNNCANQVFLLVGKRLYFVQPGKERSLRSTLILDGFDFEGNAVKTIYFDKETGRLFLGSQLYGLFVLTKKPFQAVADQSGRFNNVYYGQSLLDQHNIVTANGTVFSLDSESRGVVASHLNLLGKTVDWDQYSILKDRDQTIWCKRRETLFRFDSNGRKILSAWTMKDEIKILYEGYDGKIWIGTSALGLYYIDPDQPNAEPRFFAGKHFANISWIQHQTKTKLWIGTGKGLFNIDLPTKKISSVKGLSDIYIRSLNIPAGRDEIWIATYASGFFLLRNGELTRFPLDKGQFLASAHCIFEDKNGFLWISTNKGLFQIKRSDLLAYADKPFSLYYHYYSKADGFNTNEFNGGCQPCAVRAPNGLVSLPSINGLVWFVPERIRPELPRGQIFVDVSNDNDSTFTIDRNNISVRAGVPQIVLKVTTPYFGDPYNLNMSYRIFKDGEPLTAWKTLDESKSMAIPLQGGGAYQLSVRKINGFGPDNFSYKHLNINVQKQWHETWWFKIAVVIAVLLVFYGILKQRLNLIRSQNAALEAKVKERTEHLERTLHVLSDSEKQLEQQVRLHLHMIASISHDIRTPVRHMSFALDYSRALIEDNKLETAVTYMQQLKQAVDKMYHMVDNIVNFIKPEVHRKNSSLVQVNLRELVNEKASLFREMVGTGSGIVHIKIPPDEALFTDPKLLGIIIHNLIDNAFKVRDGNTVNIYSRREDGQLRLVFEDHGPGMPAGLLRWLNANEPENESFPTGYEGLGLMLTKEVSKVLGVQINVENSPGARIQLIFN
jgi:signal transduction histidine kinase